MTDELVAAAREYLVAGFHLLSLSGKRPNGRYHEEWTYEDSIHGVPETPEEEAAVAAIFNHPTTTGIALLIPPWLLVADVDTEAAAALFMELAGELPETPTAQTKNGLHFWFCMPGADASVWLGGRTLLFKGFGGYVAAPPSRHFDGDGNEDGVYTWLVPLLRDGVIFDVDLLPPKMADRMTVTKALAGMQPPKLYDVEEERWRIEVEFTPDGSWRLWKRWDIGGLCKAIIEAPDGNQNNVILWSALTAYDEGVPYEVAMDQLLAAAVKGGHPVQRAKTTIKGAYHRRASGRRAARGT